MPLEAPTLDTRSYEQLVEALRLRIPRYVPEWTDFNESDPGTTLVELFAWLSETIFYELNRVPERNYLKFLKLLDLELRPAQPARADLELVPRAGADIAPVLAGTRVGAQPPGGGDQLIFETEIPLEVTRVPLADVQVFDGTAFQVQTPANETPGLPYRPFGSGAQPGSALYLGFAELPQGAGDRPFPPALRFRVFRPEGSERGRAQRCERATAAPPPPVRLEWEYLPEDGARWRRLDVFSDESATLTREGYIEIRAPAEIKPTRWGSVDELRFWLRARVAAGSYPAGQEPEIDFVRANVAPASNLATVRSELVGASDGRPDQAFLLRRRPVAAGTLVLEVDEPDEEEKLWTPVPDFLASQPEDKHYLLNANTGELRFGDGRRGRIPVAGADIVAAIYRHGGGAAGNVSEGQITTMVTTVTGVESVSNPRPAVGGRDEQDVEDLKLRAPREIRRRNRAVTEEDFTSLAEEVGGVARATALPLRHPDHPGVDVPGTVTVVVLPVSRDAAPQPSSDLIRAVCRSLEAYRLLTTELFVTGPAYQAIEVEAHLAIRPYAAAGDVERDVIKRLKDAIDPRTREFGADLHPTSLYAVILGSPEVVSVESLVVAVDGVPHALSDPVVVPPGGLPYLADQDIVTSPSTER
jgi:predicted phage baseplate assembly protein